jgi:hypothetical protein
MKIGGDHDRRLGETLRAAFNRFLNLGVGEGNQAEVPLPLS